MRYHVLACDFDDTLATRGAVADETVRALERVSRSGRRLLLVTGRELDDLLAVFPHADLFDLVVAENGALLYDPGERTRDTLAPPPPEEFVERLKGQGVTPLGVGAVIVATREPYDEQVNDAIRDFGLELQVIRNKGAVMVLPPGVNKASGLATALRRLNLSQHNVVAVGDAENDHAFLAAAECGAAVANAVPALRAQCDLPLDGEDGAGVVELAELLLSGELDERPIPRHDVLLGRAGGDGGGEVRLPPYGSGLVVAGPSGGGKSTVTTALLERLIEGGHQCVVIDPEGDYAEFPEAAVLGDPDRPPGVEEVLKLLESPEQSAVVNMIGMALRDRPAFFAELLPRLTALRTRLGHPHWVVVDEAHHLMPAELQEVPIKDVRALGSLLMITVHPEALSPAALRLVGTVLAVGARPGRTLAAFADALGRPAPPGDGLPEGGVVLWRCDADRAQPVEVEPARTERTRHRRKYAAGTMSKDKSFYFTGPANRLRLRARNLHTFIELSEGVDEETWLYHLERGDYSRWIRESLGDDELADAVAGVERCERGERDARDSLRRVTALIEERYTLPSEPTKYDPDHDDR
ncbi:HAD-IIB family hydrolase [Nonomuraea muscovyensis]|uniref:HAD-IIB family hydrolase n=1 Tax=Nonomuraea muscovyensis TaxID=1124761 RepID=UPI00340BCE63